MMKSYLSLIPAYARVHKKQNRMTLLCIIFSVFLVTAIFGMADMEIRSQKLQAITRYGNWHIQIKDLSEEDAVIIAQRPDVAVSSWYNVLNYRLKDDYFIGGKRAAVCGIEPSMLTLMEYDLTEGTFPETDRQIILTEASKEILDAELGDTIALQTPDGNYLAYTVSGFGMDNEIAMKSDAIIGFLPLSSFQSLYHSVNNTAEDADMVYYIQFSEHCNIRSAIKDIQAQFGLSEEQIGENTALLGLLGFSEDSYVTGLYLIAGVLFLLVLTAGVLMVASSMNSNIAQRTEFFGLLRCLGADSRQIRRFVRMEALNWCKTAIPIGVLLSVVTIWGLCGALRYLSSMYFSDMPVFGVSLPGILAGILVGLITVLLAARSPAKKAARVSPVTAVTGNTEVPITGFWSKSSHRNPSEESSQKHGSVQVCHIETSLGVWHALYRKKNFLLMSFSFALSIILFLCFFAATAFMNHAITPLRPYTPDLSIVSPDSSCSLRPELAARIAECPGVKRVYGRAFAYDVPARIKEQEKNTMLFSYDLQQLNWAEEYHYLLDGDLSKLTEDGNYVLGVHNAAGQSLEVGQVVHTSLGDVTVVGLLSHCPIDGGSDTERLICSEDTFWQLTGESGYTIFDVQMTRHATDEDVNRIRELVGDEVLFSDQRLSNQDSRGAYWAFALFLYGFLTVIVLIACFHIINSISMSTSARMRQYGAMRAIGMSCGQFTRMLGAEAAAYAFCGCVLGCAFGLPLHWLLFDQMVTARWGTPWTIPYGALALILLVVALASVAAILRPARQIRRMSITDVIHSQ
jgi:putative ABC transport system permease protein